MYCKQCGKALDQDAKFCPNCGTKAFGSAPADTDYPLQKEDGQAYTQNQSEYRVLDGINPTNIPNSQFAVSQKDEGGAAALDPCSSSASPLESKRKKNTIHKAIEIFADFSWKGKLISIVIALVLVVGLIYTPAYLLFRLPMIDQLYVCTDTGGNTGAGKGLTYIKFTAAGEFAINTLDGCVFTGKYTRFITQYRITIENVSGLNSKLIDGYSYIAQNSGGMHMTAKPDGKRMSLKGIGLAAITAGLDEEMTFEKIGGVFDLFENISGELFGNPSNDTSSSSGIASGTQEPDQSTNPRPQKEGVEVIFRPTGDSTETELAEVATILKERLSNMGIIYVSVEIAARKIIVCAYWEFDEIDSDPVGIIKEVGQTGKLTFREGGWDDGKPIGDTANKIILTGEDVEKATSVLASEQFSDGKDEYSIKLELNSSGAEKCAVATERLAVDEGKISIWMDDMCICAYTVNAPIYDGVVFISGNFTDETSKQLADLIGSGTLPLPIKVDSYEIIS